MPLNEYTLFRPQRGSLKASMSEARVFADEAKCVEYITQTYGPIVACRSYGGFDARTGWKTHLVIVKRDGGEDAIGFTDRALTI